MAREWLLRGVDPEELKPREKTQGPVTPKGKWENFWYHYKWVFWGCVFAAVVLTVLLVQLFTRNPADYEFLLMTEKTHVEEQITQLEQMLAAYGQDLDGDGEVEVSIQNCRIAKDTNQQYNSGFQVAQAHLMAGDVLFFMWDEGAYKLFMEGLDNVLEEGVTFLTPLPAVEGVTEDGFLYDWSGDPRAQTVPGLPSTLYFGVRDTHGTAGDAQELHKESMALLEAFIKNAPVAVHPIEP